MESISTDAVHMGRPVDRAKWSGGVVAGDKVYFCPFNAPCILELTPATGAVRGLSTEKVHCLLPRHDAQDKGSHLNATSENNFTIIRKEDFIV